MSSYKESLRDVRWQRKRLEVLDSHRWQCDQCCRDNAELHVHHYWYKSGTLPWDYPNDCYGVLCDFCHQSWHDYKHKVDKLLAGFTESSMEQALGLLVGLRLATQTEDYFVAPQTDPLFMVALVRGFWPPSESQKDLIDRCLLLICRGEGFYFSEVVADVIPSLHEYEFLHDWVRRVSQTEVSHG